MENIKAKAAIYSSLITGTGSQLFFVIFLFLGPSGIFDFHFGLTRLLLFDAGLSLLFFLQHSILVRKSVRSRLSKIIPEIYYGAFYSITSGLALIIMIIFWQPAPYTIIAASSDVSYWALRVIFILCIAGFYWGIRSLDSFDPLGISTIKRHIYMKKQKQMPMTVRGAYRWMRHPLYFFLILMIWSYPYLTPDRFLFNILWTIWMITGTVMEERDLVSSFGDQYRKYREKVPMIIPYRIPRSSDKF
jgi:protein-S-isoprenylcysteine O-methyltransferase Ste14